MIEVKNIKKSFGDKVVIEDVSCVMKAGQCNLIIGSSGSGKTVLQKCMVGLFEPDEGDILYGGQNFTAMKGADKTEIRKEIGMLFQGSALFDSLNVQENVMFPLSMFTKGSFRKKLDRVNEVLARVNLVDANKKYPSELSGGMKKRVALARAIVLNPKYLFCDEPNSGL
ncbi:MAG: ATP-binding cassette domain-containing protein, partial [Chitinophagaceae bacterium]|nr:ATP-binding cassette domain-containing protein [Chitinophagaceae bacterium]